MFARYFVELPIEPLLVERAITHASPDWFRGFATEATHVGDWLLADVSVGDRVVPVRPVEVELGVPMHIPGKVLLPLRLTPARGQGPFPALEADLEVAPMTSTSTHLAISARFAPPDGPVGGFPARGVLSRAAEVTLKDFLERVGAALEQTCVTRILDKVPHGVAGAN